nr:MAG TPA: hypothetical protein [Caudoviricetes sp.]
MVTIRIIKLKNCYNDDSIVVIRRSDGHFHVHALIDE